MAVSSIVLNGTIGQSNDVLLNHNKEVGKAALDQGNIYAQEKTSIQERARKVVNSDETRFQQEKYDAKEKGHGFYQGDGGKHREKKEDADCRVVNKFASGFDVKI